ncbi:hypothetical protein AAK899_09045 [Erysipelotrichaceae bacterium 51-3]
MAKIEISNLKKGSKERFIPQQSVNAEYFVFQQGPTHWFQIDTYGSAGRKNPEKCSQSIRLDRPNVIKLMHIMIDELKISADELYPDLINNPSSQSF